MLCVSLRVSVCFVFVLVCTIVYVVCYCVVLRAFDEFLFVGVVCLCVSFLCCLSVFE